MGIGGEDALDFGQPHLLHHVEDALAAGTRVEIGVGAQHLVDLKADRHHRMSAVIGSWKIIAIVVARNCRRRRSLAVKSSSPTSLMLPPVAASEPFGSRPIVVSDVTDLPEPLSPTRHSVSRSRTCSDTPSMMRGPAMSCRGRRRDCRCRG